MNGEKELLYKSLLSVSSQKEEVSKKVWEREISVQRKLDMIEKLIQEFHNNAEMIGLIPKDAINSSGLNLDLTFNNHNTTNELIVEPDIKTIIQVFICLIYYFLA